MGCSTEECRQYRAEAKRATGLSASPCENYYGGAVVYELDGEYWLEIEDVVYPPKRCKVSAEFYAAFVKEFGGG